MLLASLRLLFLILRLPPVLLLLLPQHDSKGVAVGRPPDERLAMVAAWRWLQSETTVPYGAPVSVAGLNG